MNGFDPHDPVDPLGQYNNDPLYPDSGPIPGDPMFKDQLRQASDQVLRRAKEQSFDPMIQSDIQQELWNRQAMRTEPPAPQEVTTTVEKTSKRHDLSDEEKAALSLHLLSTTIIPLEIVNASDYGSHCKHCGDSVSPFSEGPHHDSNCERNSPILNIVTSQTSRENAV